MTMAETGLSEGSRFRARESSPESVVFTLDSNFSVFSSASASVERCSFASDAHEYDFRTSDISLEDCARRVGEHSEGNNDEFKGGKRDLDPVSNAIASTKGKKHNHLPGKGEKLKVEREDSYSNAMDGYEHLDTTRNSFSLALIECRDRRTRSETLLNMVERQRPASLDMKNVTVSSPRLAILKKSSLSPQMSGISMLQSPATTSCRSANAEIQKGWSSERVPLHSNVNLRHASSAFLPFNNGKTLPSKWEDAERWILSPGSKGCTVGPSVPPLQRRPKSKSGPLGFPGVAYNSLRSPAMSVVEGPRGANFMPSPLLAGVIAENELAFHSSGRKADNQVQNQPCMARSVSVHGCSHMTSESSSTTLAGQNFDGLKGSDQNISGDVSRRDMATQMSPENRCRSSLETWPPLSLPSPAQPIQEMKSLPWSKLEVKDVEVDGRVTMTRWSKKHKTRILCKGEVHGKDAGPVISALDASDATTNISKVMREEAKITAWENHQKAKAEAAVRKLEMKLEKKRSSSMEKIINKLKSAQKRAQEMRNSISMVANQAGQVDKCSHKTESSGRIPQRTSLSGCFSFTRQAC